VVGAHARQVGIVDFPEKPFGDEQVIASVQQGLPLIQQWRSTKANDQALLSAYAVPWAGTRALGNIPLAQTRCFGFLHSSKNSHPISVKEQTMNDFGYFHLTPHGWVRQDAEPFPPDRLETWSYEMECPAEDAKERVCLTRIWVAPHASLEERDRVRASHHRPLAATPDRNITLECLVRGRSPPPNQSSSDPQFG
jgi:hypothetical protein